MTATDRWATLRAVVRWALAALMIGAGTAHFTAHEEFLGQTPAFLPYRSVIVWVTGVIEIALGVLLVAAPRWRRQVGWALAVFLVLIFPGNVYQAVAGTDAFGLDTPTARWVRLAFQPPLILAALWSSGALPRER